MLYLELMVAEQKYLLDSSCVEEVLPIAKLRKVSKAGEYISGLLNFRGFPIPVVDIGFLLSGKKTKYFMNTRIVVVKVSTEISMCSRFGIIVEHLNATKRLSDEVEYNTAYYKNKTPYLGGVITTDAVDMVQKINILELVTEELRQVINAC